MVIKLKDRFSGEVVGELKVYKSGFDITTDNEILKNVEKEIKKKSFNKFVYTADDKKDVNEDCEIITKLTESNMYLIVQELFDYGFEVAKNG